MRDTGPSANQRPARVRLVVNADDFGRSEAVNAAVAQAFTQGILTSASLMVTGDAVDDAVGIARENPSLAVGLHLVVLGGRAFLPASVIPHLAGRDGRLSRHPFTAGVRYFFSRRARRELALEIRAQFDAFNALGLQLSHVDGHHHMHLHPSVLPVLVSLAQENGASAVRVPIADKLLFSLTIDRSHPALKTGWKIAFTFLVAWSRRSLRRCSVPTADAVFGLMETGCVTRTYLLRLLERLGRGTIPRDSGTVLDTRAQDSIPLVELFCHPSLRHESSWLGPNPGDLAALVDPEVRAAVHAGAIMLTTFTEAASSSAGISRAEAADLRADASPTEAEFSSDRGTPSNAPD